MKAIDIKLQNCSLGMGIEKNPVFCWRYADMNAGQLQKACRIYVLQEGNILYDSGTISSGIQNGWEVPIEFKTHMPYDVYIEVENQNGQWERSECFTFTSGVEEKDKKIGKWISNGSVSPFYAGKEIILKEIPEKAYISCAAAGQYELKINGSYPDDSVLNGSWTDFNKRIHYRTFEITELLKKGNNEICLETGNGWYHAVKDQERHFYTIGQGYEVFGNALAVAAVITFCFPDGRIQRFGTDKSWKIRESETIYTNIYGSEDYDARKEENEWKSQAIELTKEDAPKGKLVPMCYPAVKMKSVYAGEKIAEFDDGSLLYDLKQNMSGLFEIKVKGERGTKIRLIPVEKLDAKGNPWRTVESWCCYTLKGGERESWKPKFTYCAGRYLHIMPENGEKLPEIQEVNGYFITSSSEDTGFFSCSDVRYMQIHDLVLRAIESNLNHVHTDCPTIERLGWQEQNHLMAPSVFYVKNVSCLWEKISQDQRDSQYAADEQDVDTGVFNHTYREGLLPSIAPRYARFINDCGEGSFWDIIPWGSSILLAAYEEYRFTGNKRVLIENYETAKRYIDYLYQKYIDYAQLYGKDADTSFLCHGLGDWGIEQNRGESRENIETAYFYRDLKILSLTAKWLGNTKDEQYYTKIAESVADSYNHALLKWNPQTGEWAYDSFDKMGLTPTQATQAIPLQFDMVPKDKRDSVLNSFFMTCMEGKLKTGEIGLPYILRTLGESGKQDIVQKMLFQPYHPSYYRFVTQGETTLPEFWRDDSRSRNHDMMGAVLEWMYRYMAGISSEDGYRHIRIQPKLPAEIEWIKCHYKSIMGIIDVYVLRQPEYMELNVKIPVNTVGIVWLEEECFGIEGGKQYRFIKKECKI